MALQNCTKVFSCHRGSHALRKKTNYYVARCRTAFCSHCTLYFILFCRIARVKTP